MKRTCVSKGLHFDVDGIIQLGIECQALASERSPCERLAVLAVSSEPQDGKPFTMHSVPQDQRPAVQAKCLANIIKQGLLEPKSEASVAALLVML